MDRPCFAGGARVSIDQPPEAGIAGRPCGPQHPRRICRKTPAILLVMALVVAACTGSPDGGDAGANATATTSSTTTDAGTGEVASAAAVADDADDGPTADGDADQATGGDAAPPGETVEWVNCIEGLVCGFVAVPADYSNPELGHLQLLIAVHRATDPANRIGYLVVNPGGPGGSGVEMAYGATAGPGVAFSGPILDRFDIVGFDPRGVGFSEPTFACGEPGEQLALLSEVELPWDTDAEFAVGETATRLCEATMGDTAGLLHSEYVARDIDEIRKALGADQVSYFGISYGSTLGVWYATLFPDSVRAMVVDGADNPLDDVSSAEARIANTIDEIRQFEVLLGQALDACDSPDCPMYNDGDPRGYFIENVDALQAVNDVSEGNPLAGPLGVITTLYSQDSWPDLWHGYASLVEDGDPSILAELAVLQLGEAAHATTITSHVNCLDSWVLHPQLDRATRLSDDALAEEALARELPLLAHLEFSVPNTCAFYDLFGLTGFDGTLDGGDVPIVVVGNPLDPATPFSESSELVSETLSNGYLVEAEHIAHVVYPYNECANEIVHAALIELELPAQRHVVC